MEAVPHLTWPRRDISDYTTAGRARMVAIDEIIAELDHSPELEEVDLLPPPSFKPCAVVHVPSVTSRPRKPPPPRVIVPTVSVTQMVSFRTQALEGSPAAGATCLSAEGYEQCAITCNLMATTGDGVFAGAACHRKKQRGKKYTASGSSFSSCWCHPAAGGREWLQDEDATEVWAPEALVCSSVGNSEGIHLP